MTRRTSIKLIAGAIASVFVPFPKVAARPWKDFGLMMRTTPNAETTYWVYDSFAEPYFERQIGKEEFWGEHELRAQERKERFNERYANSI